jgi:hypothetical protein
MDTSDSYVARHKLMPFKKWLNIRHLDTYIHGPFKFASICGCKTWDHVAQPDWDVLHWNKLMFNNPVPCFDVPTYLVYCNRGAHVAFHDKRYHFDSQTLLNVQNQGYLLWHLTEGFVPCQRSYPLFFLFGAHFGSRMPLWNQCSIFPHSFTGGYCDNCGCVPTPSETVVSAVSCKLVICFWAT